MLSGSLLRQDSSPITLNLNGLEDVTSFTYQGSIVDK